jgi:hypothetical protein
MAILYSLKKTESNLVAGYRISIGIRSGISEVAPISIVYCKIRNDYLDAIPANNVNIHLGALNIYPLILLSGY